MKYITAIIYLTILSAIYSSCCKKEPEPPEPPQLTPMTTTGAETFSFLKDGEVWIADKDALSPVATIGLTSKILLVDTRKRWDVNQKEIFGFGFRLTEFQPRKYCESDTFPLNGGFFPIVDNSDYCDPIMEPLAEYLSGPFDPLDTFNFVNISHMDWSGNFKVISGTFQMRMINVENEECQDTIYITDGRFDLEFDVIP